MRLDSVPQWRLLPTYRKPDSLEHVVHHDVRRKMCCQVKALYITRERSVPQGLFFALFKLPKCRNIHRPRTCDGDKHSARVSCWDETMPRPADTTPGALDSRRKGTDHFPPLPRLSRSHYTACIYGSRYTREMMGTKGWCRREPERGSPMRKLLPTRALTQGHTVYRRHTHRILDCVSLDWYSSDSTATLSLFRSEDIRSASRTRSIRCELAPCM